MKLSKILINVRRNIRKYFLFVCFLWISLNSLLLILNICTHLSIDVVVELKIVNFLIGWLLGITCFFIFAYYFARLTEEQSPEMTIGFKDTFLILFFNEFLTKHGIHYKSKMFVPLLGFLIIIALIFSFSITPK